MKNNFAAILILFGLFLVFGLAGKQNVSAEFAAGNFPDSTKVLVLDFNPRLPSRGNVTLREYRNWNHPDDLESRFIENIGIASRNFVNYQIVDRVVIDDFPTKADGFDYNDQSYLACLENAQNCHRPDGVDYIKILRDYNVCSRRNQGEIDELWLWGGPYFGYWEAVMAGPGGFWTNAPAIEIPECQKKLNIMGFNYERGISEMLEDFLHRAEGTMTHVFGSWEPELTHDWNRFSVLDKNLPDSAGCGNAHWGHNSIIEYQMNIAAPKNSSCRDWINYPHLSGIFQSFDCSAWGCPPGNNDDSNYNFKKWWLGYFPANSGHNNLALNNWFKYILDFDAAAAEYSCAGQPNVYLLSPANGSNAGGGQSIQLSAHADFNTCVGSRARSIWVKDQNTQSSFSQLCYYFYDQGDTDFNCGLSIQTGHRYSWYASAQNESFSKKSDIWEFDAGTVIPTSTPAACNPLSDCSGSYPGFHYDFTPRFPECAMPPSYPDGTGKPDPYYNAASFGDYTCSLTQCGGSCTNTASGCSFTHSGYRYSFIPTNYPACSAGQYACGGSSWPNWAGEDPACDFANNNGDDFTRDVTCGAAACVTPTPTPTPGFGLTTPAPPTPGFGRRRR